MRTFYITERTPGNAFTTYKSKDGAAVRVPIGADRIGPFPSIPAAADYLSAHALPQASYLIEEWRTAE